MRRTAHKVFPLDGNTKGIDIYNNLVAIVNAYRDFEKCVCIATDCATAITRQKNGLVGILKDCGVHCPTFHCIIHQKALRTNLLHMRDVMISVANILNIVKDRNRSQRHRKFIQFLKDVEGQNADVLLYSKIRWLSSEQTLKHFFFFAKRNFKLLHSETEETTEKYQLQLKDDKFIGSSAFLTDIRNHLN